MLLIFQTMKPSDLNIKGLYQMPLGNPSLFMIDCELIVTQNILTLYFIHFSTKDWLLKYAFKIPVINHNFFFSFFQHRYLSPFVERLNLPFAIINVSICVLYNLHLV